MTRHAMRLLLLVMMSVPQPGWTAAAHAQSTITYMEVALDEDTRRADEKLRRYLALRTGSTFVAERPLEYGAAVNRLAAWRPDRGDFLARTTPYAFVAAEMLGAQMDGLATYVSAATGGTTYHAYFVVRRDRFPVRPEPAAVVEHLRTLGRPATFVYHSKFSTSSYLVPALFFRANGIYNMAESSPHHTAIHAREYGSTSADLVRAVADGRFDMAAVWDGTRTRFLDTDSLYERYGSKVQFIRLPTPLPNDLLVVSAGMDSVTRGRIEAAIAEMGEEEIGEGDFLTWQNINNAPAAREALANLRWLARERPPSVTIDVRQAGGRPAVPERLLEAARQAVRLSSTEFVNYDDDFHAHRDYLWSMELVRDGMISLTSRIVGSDVEDQVFRLSFGDEEDLTHRLNTIIQSRLHRVRYVWPYRPERPTVIRDVGFSLPPGTTVRVRRVYWLHAQRNHFQEDAEFEAQVAHADFFKLELEPNFIAPAEAGFGFDPMSNISYRVILIRPASEPVVFRVLTVVFVLLLVLAAGTAVRAAPGLTRRSGSIAPPENPSTA
jgi:ABC-type phosphate/phosphonate transport system substrate-binding protein